MKRNVMRKNLLRTIRGSFGRYIAIVAIIALGASMFVGLLSTKSDMVATGQKYMDAQNMFDLRLLSTYGWTQSEVDTVANMAGVEYAEGAICMDVIGSRYEGETDSVYKLHSIPNTVSKVYLLGGRMPQSPDECLVDGHFATDAVLGTEFTVADENTEDVLDSLHYRTYTVVGYISTPLYMDMSRGSTSIGTGNVSGYIYIPEEAFNMEVYTEIAVTIQGQYEIYTQAFTDALATMADNLKPGVTLLADARYTALKADAEAEYEKGEQEYLDGVAEYEQAKEEALASLADALQQLNDAQAEIDENRLTLEDGLKQLADAQQQLDDKKTELITGRQELAEAKTEAYAALAEAYAELMANYKTVSEAQKQVKDGIAQIDTGLVQIDDGIAQIEDGLDQIEDGISQLDTVIPLKEMQVNSLNRLLTTAQNSLIKDERLIAELQKEADTAQGELDAFNAQRQELVDMQTQYTAQAEDLKKEKVKITKQRETLLETQKMLDDSMALINDGMLELQSQQTQTDNQFASAEAQLESGQIQLDAAQKLLDAQKTQADAGVQALNEAQAELDAGFADYESGKREAEAEFADAEAKLSDAAAQLADARETIDSMAEAEVYILDRNTNVGYLGLDSNSDIVAGVSRVFPAFFLLVAALVCITTMTRMVEEERTQIGTFKALGYSNWAIIRKYISYAGSAAILGCTLGVVLGSIIFPTILWDVYGLLLNITPKVVLQLDWILCGAVIGAYTIVMLLVTWYCCKRSLREVPAELIRPKAPTSGKKIFLEYLPFWKRISFLNKVMLRNVFRYRQRMLMMLVGIGGCTALLLTGFGLRDSIVGIVSNQFDKVTTYDMGVYFSEGQTADQQLSFRDSLRKQVSDMHFFYQTSVELESSDDISEIYMVLSDDRIADFIHLRRDGEELPMPQADEVLLSVGVAENMGIEVGDTVILRDSDMKTLTLKVAGVYDNHVYNYAIVSPESAQKQWGEIPMSQMAVVNIRDYADLGKTSAAIIGMAGVMNVTVNEDVAEKVNTMLEALDTIVVVVVICAGALAVIVLYNLTNINITERIREIATIKVLGFRSGESAAYVFKENLLLSGMGVLVGLVMGKYLLDFVISQVKVDMIWITPEISAMSCVYAVVLTMLSAVLVDFLLYFKLEKINMAEALKSVE